MSAAVGGAAAVAHHGVIDRARRHRPAGRRARGRARRPWRPPDSRHWASGGAGVAPHRAPGRAGRGVAAQAPRRRSSSSARKPRRRQIDEIVEPRGGPAERLVARRAVADHAVGGVDRLVERGAGEPGDGHPERRRDDRRRRNSRRGFRSRRARRRPRRALRGRGRRSGLPRRGRRRGRPFRAPSPPRRRAGAGCAGRSACWPASARQRCRTAGAAASLLHDEGDRADNARTISERDDPGARAAASAAPLAVEPAVERSRSARRSRSPDGRSRAAARSG